MRKSTIVLFLFLLCAGVGRLSAQSLQNTAWKFYVEALHDTLTMHIGVDTTFSTTSSGDMIVRSTCTVVKDTIRLKDIDGQYPCLEGEGVYRYIMEGDYMTFHLVTDPCENRVEALKECRFLKTTGK
jgi:hypothetical protein